MNRQLGPLKLWQWGLIGVAIGAFTLLRAKSKPTATAATGAPGYAMAPGTLDTTPAGTPSTAGTLTDLGPVDPSTGLPYAFEFLQGVGNSGSQSGPSGINALQQELSDLANINGQMQELGLNGLTTSTAVSSKTGDTNATGAPHVPSDWQLVPTRKAKKPSAPSGFTTVGLGNGWWAFRPTKASNSTTKSSGTKTKTKVKK